MHKIGGVRLATEEEVIDGTSNETQGFLLRRLEKLKGEIGTVCNINPFMMCALRDFHQLTEQRALAQLMLAWHLGDGHATSFGKMVDERLLPNVFGTLKLSSSVRQQNPYNLSPFDNIDHVVTLGGRKYLLSLKASSWTIQLGQATNLYHNFKTIGDNGMYGHAGIVVGVFYGNETMLTDKYRVLRGENTRRQSELTPLSYVEVRAGKDFWSWLNGGEEETQEWVQRGILKGTDDFQTNYPDCAEIVGNAVSKLEGELRTKYDLPADGSLDWIRLLHAINDNPTETIHEDSCQSEIDSFCGDNEGE